MTPRPRSITSVHVLLNTLEHEKHARGALLVALADELRVSLGDDAPESTRTLLARAERGEMTDAEFPILLGELRALARTSRTAA